MYASLMKIFLVAAVAVADTIQQVEKSTSNLLQSLEEDEKASSLLAMKLDLWCRKGKGAVGKAVAIQQFMHNRLTNDLKKNQAAVKEVLWTISRIRAKKDLLFRDLKELDSEGKTLAKKTEHKPADTTVLPAMRRSRLATISSEDAQLNTWLPILSEGQQRVARTKRHKIARQLAGQKLREVFSLLQGACQRWDVKMMAQSRERMVAAKSLTRAMEALRMPAPASFLQMSAPAHDDRKGLRTQMQSLITRFKGEAQSKRSKQWCAEEMARNQLQKQEALDAVQRITALQETAKQSASELERQLLELTSMKKTLKAQLSSFQALDKEAVSFIHQVANRTPLAVKISSQAISLLRTKHHPAVPALQEAIQAFRALEQVSLTPSRASTVMVEIAFRGLNSYFAIARDDVNDDTRVKLEAVHRADANVAAAEAFLEKLKEECAAAEDITKNAETSEAAFETELGTLDTAAATDGTAAPKNGQVAAKKTPEPQRQATSPLEQAAIEIGVPLD
eukprot:GEMP01033946.1.p1 GENE.GEMP01033946.1~~GEMP01033946.1.p1  ORF type:complete len:507 (+),score=150.06 GEMP01033946.1:175-1695(+)